MSISSLLALLDELKELYRYLQNNEEIVSCEAISYRKYVEHQRAQPLETVRVFWKHELNDFIPKNLVLTTHHTNLAPEDVQIHRTALSSELSQSIKEFCHVNKTPIESFFLGIWSIELNRFALRS